MAKPNVFPCSQDFDSRLYCDYARLVRTQVEARKLTLLPRLVAGTPLAGRHLSKFRGRGLNFEELRHYQIGDDIRNLDWKVTYRTGKPHVRCYSEEKDRNIMVCVDQRSKMFFSSVDVMKSVVAAEVSALCAWAALKEGDRVGFILSKSQSMQLFKSQRTQHGLLEFFKRLSAANQELNVDSVDHHNVSFSQQIRALINLRLKNSTIILISDWSDTTDADLEQLKQLQRHNDVLSIMVSDPMEQSLPVHSTAHQWVVGDGEWQLTLDSKRQVQRANHTLVKLAQQKREALIKLMAVKQLPLIELSTDGSHLSSFISSMGGR